ncbi:JDVT-CTERM system glutamic-type intramembrane protease [Thioalkalivibrio sp. ALE30]|uniref:JDVT-CTERM system glutamic-type intramembrane protease MrtJ n=1 Tax=Thioalkalivibrio sp. ALE30 TaxID=1158181 RepID=UPI000364E06C|nr:JDVT-CTERM system glutamic-type intramembrane protease [Thioalkalivibrio sp. ALE30]
MSRQAAPDSRWRDPHLHLLLAATAVVGLGLWVLLPPGYARPIVADHWHLLAVLLLYPVVEEWLFRGLLQGELLRRPRFRERHLGVTRANLLTSAVFASLHLVHQPPLWALSILVPSLALGHFRERYGNLRWPIALHILFNGVYILAGLAPTG